MPSYIHNSFPRSPWVWLGVLPLILAAVMSLPLFAQTPVNPSSNGKANSVLISPDRIATLKKRVAANTEPTAAAYAQVLADANAALTLKPSVPEVWMVPPFYENAEGHRAAKKTLQDDGNAVYALGLAYAMTGEEKYALAAARLINAWAGLAKLEKVADSTLSFSYHFPAMVFGAALIRSSPSWPEEEQKRFETFLREKALPMNTMAQANNWGNWGDLLAISIAAYLGDRPLFDQAIARWKELLGGQMDAQGHLTKEVTRNNGTGQHGLWYSHFSLMPATLAAEVARVHGVDLFDYKSPEGHSLLLAFTPVAGWAHDPATFPYFKGVPKELHGYDYASYFEILDAHWPQEPATALLKEKRPMTAQHSAPYLTFTHGDLLLDK